MSKLSDNDKLKYWLDGEFSVLHVMLAVILYQVVTSWWQHALICTYIVFAFLYAVIRLVYVSSSDKNYLKIPKE